MAGELVLPGYIDPKLVGGYKPARRLSSKTVLSRQSPTLSTIYERRNARPTQPIFLYNAQGKVTTILMPMGQTEVSELDDIIQGHYEKKQALDFDAWREAKGLPPRDKAVQLMQDAIQERIDRHKRNPVTDPFRQPRYSDRTPNVQLPDRPWRKD